MAGKQTHFVNDILGIVRGLYIIKQHGNQMPA